MDINSAGVDHLCNLGLDCRVLNAVDIETLDSEPFDVVFVGDLIEHLPNPGDFLKKLRRLVKPRTGLVLIATNNALHWLNPVGMMPPRTREQRRSWGSRGQHTMWFCSVTLRNLMRFAGYRQQSMFFVTSWQVFAASDWWRLQRKCRLAIERVLFRVNPELADAIFGVYQPVDEFDDETERRFYEERWHENAIKREEAKAADQDGPSSGICVVMTDATYSRARSHSRARQMVVLHVMPDLFPHGGTPRKLAGATGRLRKRGICQAVLVFGEADEGMVGQITTAGGRVLRAPRRAASDPRLIWDVAAASVRIRADVVVTHFARADIYGALGARLVGRAVIKELEGIFWSDRSELIACDRMLGRLRSLVVANSKATLQAARRRGGVGRAAIVYLGVGDAGPRDSELGRQVREELGIAERSAVVGHIGGFIALRRQETLIEAMAMAAREAPQLQLVLIGDGPLRSSLAHQVHLLGLDENVTMLGYRGDVDRLRHAFDVYVNPAEAEGFGLATVEGMLTGIPVIVADAGASPELVADGQTGVVVPAGDSTALARAIVGLVECPDRAFAMGQAARAAALQRFSMDRYADGLERVYRYAAGSRRWRGDKSCG